MKYEDIEIRIARDGKVYVRVDGITEERVRSFREFLEEQIGPVHSVELVQTPDWDRPAGIVTEESHDEIEMDRKG